MDAAATEPWFFTLFDDESFGSFIAVKKPTRHASFGLLAKAAAAELDRDDVAQVRLALYIVTDAAGMPLRTKPTDAQCRSAISGAVLDGVDSPADASFSRAGKCFFVLKIKNGTSTVTHAPAAVREAKADLPFQIAAAYQPQAEVRVWLSRTGRRLRLGATLEEFKQIVRVAFDLGACLFELYRFPSEACIIAERIKLDSTKQYKAFRRLLRTEEFPVAWLYLNPGGDKVRVWSSPQAGPAASDSSPAALTAAAPPKSSAASEATSVASSGKRNGPQQADFRLQVYRRNGKKWECAACGAPDKGGDKGIQAAHIIRRDAAEALLPSGLYSSWDVSNGMLLCDVCHPNYDALAWKVLPGEVIEVSRGLLENADGKIAAHFAGISQKSLRFPPLAARGDGWPKQSAFAVQARLYDEKAVRRRAHREEFPFICYTCHRSWKTAGPQGEHECKPRTSGERFIFSPYREGPVARADDAAAAAASSGAHAASAPAPVATPPRAQAAAAPAPAALLPRAQAAAAPAPPAASARARAPAAPGFAHAAAAVAAAPAVAHHGTAGAAPAAAVPAHKQHNQAAAVGTKRGRPDGDAAAGSACQVVKRSRGDGEGVVAAANTRGGPVFRGNRRPYAWSEARFRNKMWQPKQWRAGSKDGFRAQRPLAVPVSQRQRRPSVSASAARARASRYDSSSGSVPRCGPKPASVAASTILPFRPCSRLPAETHGGEAGAAAAIGSSGAEFDQRNDVERIGD